MHPITSLSCLLATGFLVSSCDYRYDTVNFKTSAPTAPNTGPVPRIYIETNMSVSGMAGGTVRTSKPYSIKTHHLDDTFTFAAAEYSAVTVTYADGTEDPGTAALKLPKRIGAEDYEVVNSTTGGVIVTTNYRIIKGKFPGTVGRDEPFTLHMEGKVIKDDGSTIPFTIRQRYDVVRDKRTQTWAEFVSDC